jgi:hypothetical protein
MEFVEIIDQLSTAAASARTPPVEDVPAARITPEGQRPTDLHRRHGRGVTQAGGPGVVGQLDDHVEGSSFDSMVAAQRVPCRPVRA